MLITAARSIHNLLKAVWLIDEPALRGNVMAVQITASCINCWACQPLCPAQAIYKTEPHFWVDVRKCTECEGDYAEPQCASICPVESAIVDKLGNPINPPGTLTGIPPQYVTLV
jgi:ferredoxin